MVRPVPRVVIYTRLSQDEHGDQTATARQDTACRAYALSRGWSVTETFEDVDLSAYRRNVARPSYERLRSAIRNGECDGVLVWKLDRLVRRPAEFERFWEVCERDRVFLASVTEPVDSSTEIGLAIVRVLVTFAGLESSTIGLRITARLKEKAQAGEPPGIPRPFGMTEAWDGIVPAEAALIREAAKRVLAGEGFRNIAEDWKTRAIPGTRGQLWSSTQIRKTLRNPRLCGDRAWKGEVVARDCFPAILDRVTFERLQLVMADRSNAQSPILRKYLLSSLLVCAECGHNLHGRSAKYPTYFCSTCSRVSVSVTRCDAVLTGLVFERLRHRRTLPRARPAASFEGTVGRHASQLEALNRDYYVERIIDRSEFLETRALLGARTASVRPKEPEAVADGLPRTFKIQNAEVSWPVLTTPQRRAVIAAEMAHATVTRAARPVTGFDASRIVPRWRSDV